jgi:hypothetical protein
MPLLDGISPGYSRSALIDGRLVWLLEIEYAGAIWRWSSRPVEVVGDAGTFVFGGGLDAMDFDDALAIVSDASRERSVSVSVLWPSPGVAVLIQRGHDLAAGIGQLSLWMEGETYESRMVVIQGLLSQPEYGNIDEPVSFSVTEQPLDDLAEIIPPSLQIDDVTFPIAPESSHNQRYPLPFFAPGATRPDGVLSPAYAIEYTAGTKKVDTILISGFEPVATTVEIGVWVDHELQTTTLPVQTMTDGLGRTVWVCDITGETADFTQADEWFVHDWGAGGIRSPYRSGPLRTAGELMRYLADRSSVRVDRARFASIASQLAWPVEGYIDDDATALGYMIDVLLPILPVSLASGPQGLHPVLWRYDARREDAVEALVSGPGVARVGNVTYQAKPADLIQRITLEWGFDAHTRKFTRSTILEPTNPTADTRSHSSAFIRGAASRYNADNPAKWRTFAAESELIGDEVTAGRFLAWKIRQLGYSPRLVDYEVGQEFGWLELGAVITLTDSELYLDEVVALVVGRTMQDTGIWRLQLQILDDLASTESVGPSQDQTSYPSWVPGGN